MDRAFCFILSIIEEFTRFSSDPISLSFSARYRAHDRL